MDRPVVNGPLPSRRRRKAARRRTRCGMSGCPQRRGCRQRRSFSGAPEDPPGLLGRKRHCRGCPLSINGVRPRQDENLSDGTGSRLPFDHATVREEQPESAVVGPPDDAGGCPYLQPRDLLSGPTPEPRRGWAIRYGRRAPRQRQRTRRTRGGATSVGPSHRERGSSRDPVVGPSLDPELLTRSTHDLGRRAVDVEPGSPPRVLDRSHAALRCSTWGNLAGPRRQTRRLGLVSSPAASPGATGREGHVSNGAACQVEQNRVSIGLRCP